MLKKIAHIILSLLLLISTTGITITWHYCGNALERIAINSEAKSCCENDGCCHNESTLYQVKDDFSAPESIQALKEPVFDAFLSTVFVVQCYEPLTLGFTSFPVAESPPAITTNTILSFLQTFLC
jgi:hypothetical protein